MTALSRRFLLVALAGFCFALPATARASTPLFHNGDGLQVLSTTQVNSQVIDLQLKTAALPKPVPVYVLLPVGYQTQPHRHYPVIYLLHGAGGDPDQWLTLGHAQQDLGNRPVITVIPPITLDDASSGWCADWANGAQNWETFHIDELLPWIDANLRTIPTRSERAIAGLSEGGFCAMTYAARHPDLFGVALSYSGAVETWYDLTERSTLVGLISYFEAYDGLIPGTVFGDPVTDGMNWAAHDPATLAANLLDTRMMFYCGDGEPGPLDPIATLPSENLSGEPVANLETKALQSRLNSLGIPATYDYYGAGTHNWPYWNRDLQWSIDSIMNDFAHPAPVPQDFTYTSAEPEYNVYGWSVAANRNTLAFTTLSVTGASAFTLAGIGTATVTTSRRYRPGRTYVINLMPDGQTPIRDRVTASQDGRLTITVPLGTGDAPESAGLTAAAPSTPDDPTTVTISRVTQRKGTVSRRLPRSV